MSVSKPSETTGGEQLMRIAARARRIARERLRRSLDGQATAATVSGQPPAVPDGELLDRIADEEAARAGGALLRVSVVHAVSQELGIALGDALDHPAVAGAQELLRKPGPGAPGASADRGPAAATREPVLLLDAVHVFGIETLEPGDRDIELRFADVGIDVRKPSTAETLGRLRWHEIRTVALQRPRRGLPGRRRPGLFVARTERGEVTFELPNVSDDEITDQLEPLMARHCAGYRRSDGG